MNRADPCAGQHGNRQFRHQRHIDRDHVAPAYPQFLQRVGKPADLGVQHLVGQHAGLAGLAFPDQGRLVPPRGLKMDVQTVVGNVCLPADEPLGKRLVPLEHLLEGLEPVQFISHAAPESLQVFSRLTAQFLILRHGTDSGLRRKFAWRREDPLFFHHVIDLAGPRRQHKHSPPEEVVKRSEKSQWKLSISFVANSSAWSIGRQ